MTAQWIVDLHVEVGEVLPVAKSERRNVRHRGKRNALAEALETGEEEVPIVPDRAAQRAAELIRDVFPARRAHLIVLRVVGVKLGIAQKFEHRSVKGIRSGLQ